jgi:hypothetical protein
MKEDGIDDEPAGFQIGSPRRALPCPLPFLRPGEACDRLGHVQLFFLADGGERPSADGTPWTKSGGPEDTDFERLAGADAGRREAGRAGVHDLGPAAQRAVAVDQEVLLLRHRLRQGHGDFGPGGRPFPARSDSFPIEIGHVAEARDGAP